MQRRTRGLFPGLRPPVSDAGPIPPTALAARLIVLLPECAMFIVSDRVVDPQPKETKMNKFKIAAGAALALGLTTVGVGSAVAATLPPIAPPNSASSPAVSHQAGDNGASEANEHKDSPAQEAAEAAAEKNEPKDSAAQEAAETAAEKNEPKESAAGEKAEAANDAKETQDGGSTAPATGSTSSPTSTR